MTNSFAREAARCRREADRFAGRAEESFLLKLSAAFEELAILETQNTRSEGDKQDRESS
jgi:hypothetical protein